ncbi:MAG: HAMP domain-containing histidine kinase [Alphaproteobacteria bacterium]|nr:HAMP domain-containing histidine kinase [Alphaproteobacteria bacterium]
MSDKSTDKATKTKLWGFGGLSSRLLMLTIIFILLGEFLIFVPSLANFRNNWLNEKLAKAQIATLVLDASPDNMVDEALEGELLSHVGAEIVALKRGEMRQLILQRPTNSRMIEASFDLRNESVMQQIMAVFDALLAPENRLIKIRGATKFDAGDFVEIVIDENTMRAAMWTYGKNIMGLSIILSIIVAAMIYMALHWLLVRPIKRITQSIVDFGQDPDQSKNMIVPSKRTDEVGIAEQQLLQMQLELQTTLKEKNRLAALGLAVSKISHDLRNMLSSTQMISDRLQNSEDPTVARLAPKMEAALDRAINFCVRTLKYGQAKEEAPQKTFFALQPLLDDVADTLSLDILKTSADENIGWDLNIDEDDLIYADRHQLFRIILNISRNAADILKNHQSANQTLPRIFICYLATQDMQYLVVADNGPGVMERAKQSLFNAFQGSMRPGGTGLGLAISQELAQAHGGDIKLIDDLQGDEPYAKLIEPKAMKGAIFLIELPNKSQTDNA